jgi:hypothetical protein
MPSPPQTNGRSAPFFSALRSSAGALLLLAAFVPKHRYDPPGDDQHAAPPSGMITTEAGQDSRRRQPGPSQVITDRYMTAEFRFPGGATGEMNERRVKSSLRSPLALCPQSSSAREARGVKRGLSPCTLLWNDQLASRLRRGR